MWVVPFRMAMVEHARGPLVNVLDGEARFSSDTGLIAAARIAMIVPQWPSRQALSR